MSDHPPAGPSAAGSRAVRAFLVVVGVALGVDALLGVLTGAVSSVGGGPGGPWWVSGHVLERSRWLVFVLLLAVALRTAPLGDPLDALTAPREAWRLVGTLSMLIPVLWIVASWIVQAALFTLADRWDVDGQIFRSPDYYRQLFAGYAPWLLGGAASVVLGRHAR